MSGSRLHSFRQGDLAEGLGLEMLRRFCAVAPVPREEDFGVDAICTLLRLDGRKLFAERTFAVQVKAASTVEFQLKEDGYKWLAALDLPFFLLTVDLKAAAARLYSYEWTMATGTYPWASTVTLHLTKPSARPSYDRQPWLLGYSSPPSAIWLGPPIVEFTLDDLNDVRKVDWLYGLMAEWAAVVADCIYFRRFRIQHDLEWATGSPPRRTVTGLLGTGDDAADLREIFEAMVPLVLKAQLHLRHPFDGSDLKDEFRAILRKARDLGLRGAGIDP